MKYIKRPVQVTVLQWNGNNIDEMIHFIEKSPFEYVNGEFKIEAYGNMKEATISDYIIKGGENDFYPCKENIFYQTYSHVEGNVWAKKPVIIDAICVDTASIEDIKSFCGDMFIESDGDYVCKLYTLEGIVNVVKTDYIIKGVQGEFYPSDKDKFLSIYDEVNA